MKKNNKQGKPVLLIAILVLVLVFSVSGLLYLGSTDFYPTGATQNVPSKTIVRDGVEYFPRQDITVILVAGIDEYGKVQSSGSYNNTGEADMVTLLIFDEKDKVVDVLSLNRDTMLEMPVLGIGGKPAGTRYGQLALAHTYGTGLEDSGKNLRDTVSNFLYGAYIDYYVTMNMDAIAILNDAVGGVKVNVTDDFSEIDPTIQKGEMVLTGKQAVTFVQTRQGLGDQLNTTRMERQREYMTGFLAAVKDSINGSGSFALNTYEAVGDYTVTDCSTTALSTLVNRLADYQLGEIESVKGENVKGEKYMEYHVDEEALDQLILKYLYAPKK